MSFNEDKNHLHSGYGTKVPLLTYLQSQIVPGVDQFLFQPLGRQRVWYLISDIYHLARALWLGYAYTLTITPNKKIHPMRLMIALLSLLMLLMLLMTFVTQGAVTRFDRLSVEHGLSQSSVLSIVQDRKGFLWFATQDGLNRYDGYSFKVFRHNPDDAHSISGNSINTLTIDSAGVLWIGTLGGGLNRY
ncbi:MAG: hypothetical protein ACI8WB_005570, partial [Phenylobacterium sp.]